MREKEGFEREYRKESERGLKQEAIRLWKQIDDTVLCMCVRERMVALRGIYVRKRPTSYFTWVFHIWLFYFIFWNIVVLMIIKSFLPTDLTNKNKLIINIYLS